MSKFREWTLVGAYIRHMVGNTDSGAMHSAIATLPQIPVGQEVKVIEYAALEAERERSKKLVEALEFYAKPEHWTNIGRSSRCVFSESDEDDLKYRTEDDILYISGARARKALKSYKEGAE